MATTPAIELIGLTKNYGTFRVVDSLKLTVPQGKIYGFLGPNGAGKTTTIRLLMDLLRPSAGSAKILGLDTVRDSVSIKRRIGYLSGDMEMDPDLTGAQYIDYMMNLHGTQNTAKRTLLANRLHAELDKKIRNLSRGNKQKIGLIAALLHEPELLIFDEPTSGLDPLMQSEFNALMREHQARGGTVFMSSHVLAEVQQICDHVAFIRDGKILAEHSMSDLSKIALRQVWITAETSIQTIQKAVKGMSGVTDLTLSDSLLHFHFTGDINALLKALTRYTITDIRIAEADLDALFMQYFQKEQNSAD